MRRFTFFFVLLLAGNAFAQAPAGRYSIKGYLTHLKGRTIYLTPPFQYENPTGSLADSCVSADGHFSFQGMLGEAKYYTLSVISDGRKRSKNFILDDTPITIIGNADSLEQVSIAGSLVWLDQLLLDRLLAPSLKRQPELMRLILRYAQKGDTANKRVYSQEYDFLLQDMIAKQTDFIDSHSSSLVSLFTLSLVLPNIPNAKARHLWNQLDYSLQQHSVGKRLHDQIFTANRKAEPRQYLPALILTDKQDKPVSLLDYKGSVTLIDFWASWCDHCRQEHNRLKALYRQYKDKGLQIVSISVDEDPKAWKKALQQTGLPWTQLSDRVGSRNVVGTQYGTNTIPINLLIDKDGYVIRKGLHGTELEKQLAVAID